MSTRYAISVDVGGTFTDLVLFDMDAGVTTAVHKVLTDPVRPARSVTAGWRDLLDETRATADEIQIHVRSAAADVTEETSVAINPVESDIDFEHDAAAGRREVEEGRSRRPRVALAAAELRRVDLDEADAAPVAERKRVPVVHGGDDACAG